MAYHVITIVYVWILFRNSCSFPYIFWSIKYFFTCYCLPRHYFSSILFPVGLFLLKMELERPILLFFFFCFRTFQSWFAVMMFSDVAFEINCFFPRLKKTLFCGRYYSYQDVCTCHSMRDCLSNISKSSGLILINFGKRCVTIKTGSPWK